MTTITTDPTGYGELVLDRLARQACEVMGTERSCIMVRDRHDPRVAIAAATHGVDGDLMGSRVVLDSGPVGHAFAFGRPAAGREAGSSPYWKARWDDGSVTACAPIGARPEVRGALSASSSEARRRFSQQELFLLRELAELAAGALDHAVKRDGTLRDLRLHLERALGRLAVHDPISGRHATAVAEMAPSMGEHLGLSTACLLELELAALLHDLGKVAVPAEILSKAGPLDEGEWEIVERHPLVGAELLREVPGLEPVATIVRYHHERWDGQGYPYGLSGERIPLASRIVSVCDGFHAMTSDRPYSAAIGRDEAIAELHAGAGEQFDRRVVEAFDRSVA